MDSFEKVGFLSGDLEGFKRKVKDVFPSHYEYLSSINRFSQGLQYRVEIHAHDLRELVSAILFARTLSTFQAFILISERGMIQQTKMLLRCMFESLFPLVAISKDKAFTKKFRDSDEYERKRALNKYLIFHKRNNPSDPMIPKVEKRISEIKEHIKKNQIKKVGVEDAARDAGLIDWYDTVYSLLSSTVHASVRSLEEALEVDNKRNITTLKNEPELKELGHLYTVALEAMQFAIIAMAEIFGIDVKDFIQDLSKKIKEFAVKLEAEVGGEELGEIDSFYNL
jgi:hypothetical protein